MTERCLLVTCTHFNNAPEVEAFIAQLNELALPQGWRLEIAIGDTSANWPRADSLPPNAHLFRSEVNLGYLNGCAFALARWLALAGENGKTAVQHPWVAVMNTDLTLAPDFCVKLLTPTLSEDIALVAPSVRLPDGTAQNPFFRKRPNRARMFAYTVIYRSNILTSLLHCLHRVKRGRPGESVQSAATDALFAEERSVSLPRSATIYAAHGSVFVLLPRFFERGGTLDYAGFLFGEELYIAEQIRTLGLRSLWIAGALVVHRAHATTGLVPDVRRRRWMLQSARVLWRSYWQSDLQI